MKILQFETWVADLNPRLGTEPGKTRPVLIVQTNLLNETNHPSSLVCPLTTNVAQANLLRVHVPQGIAGAEHDCDIMIDQVRAIDNRRLKKKIGILPKELSEVVKENLRIIFDLFD